MLLSYKINSMREQIEKIKKDFAKDLAQKSAFELKVKYLGRKKGLITELMKELAALSTEHKKEFGPEINKLKEFIESRIMNYELKDKRADEDLDQTLPGLKPNIGTLHPVTQVLQELSDYFTAMGFKVLEGPEVESEFFNFEALNVPAWHPAREMQDTIWTAKEGILLRTQTSPMQIRAMLEYGAPLYCVVPGRVFRYEATDARHDHTFYQLEGLVVDENISVANMNAFLRLLVEKIVGAKAKMRIRPGYFPFVEPGVEVDVECAVCQGKGCGLCKHTGWVESVGAGMVHPKVLQSGKINPQKYSGFAFGVGINRLTQMKFGFEDTRLIHQNDLRFLRQF